MPGETLRITTVSVRETGIRTVLTSGGSDFWNSLPPDRKSVNRDRLADLESWLTKHLPEPPAAPANLLAARRLTLGMSLNRQVDSTSYTYIAVANALRILYEPRDGPRPEYSLSGLQARVAQVFGGSHYELTPESVDRIFKSGEPFDKFQTAVIPDMHTFLRKLRAGAVAILDWPYSPTHTRRYGVDYTQARTVTGFTRNSEGLFFHFVDPYYNQEATVYSFRDLMVACLYQTIDLNSGVTPDSIDRVARSALIIERSPVTGIRTTN